jgi:hypothetical protein
MSTSSIVRFVLTGSIAFIVACGGAPESSSPETSAFAGRWTCSGAQVENCPNGTHVDNFIFTLATSSAGASVLAAVTSLTDMTTGTSYGPGGVPLGFMVLNSQTATLDGPQTEPTGPGSLGGEWTPTYTSGTLTQSPTSLNWTDSGTGVFVDGYVETCGFSQNYTCARD